MIFVALFAVAQLEHVDRVPIAMIVVAPLSEAKVTKTSELIAAAGELLRANTDLVVRPVEPELVKECGGQIPCMADRARVEVPSARFLALFSALPREGRDVLAATLIDLARREAAVDLVRAEVASSEDARAFVEERFSIGWRDALKDHLAPFGEVALDATAEAVLAIDGETVGPIAAGRTVIKTRPGSRKLALDRGAELLPWAQQIEVPRGGRVEVRAELVERSNARAIAMWSAGAVGLGGAVIATYAFASADRDTMTLCLYEDDRVAACGEGARFPGAVPIGIALGIAGATTAVLTALIGGEDPPWLEAAIGVAAGALAFGVISAADGVEAQTTR